MEYTKFSDPEGRALPGHVVDLMVDANRKKGLTDDGVQEAAKELKEPVTYWDPGLPLSHGPAMVVTNTLQQKRAIASGFLTDRKEVQRLRDAAQAAKDAEVK